MSAKRSGRGNLRIELDEILIGRAVAGHRRADARNHLEGIEFVQRIEARHGHCGKFQAEEASADLEHAVGLLKRAFDARHVADAEGDGDAIEAAVGIGQFFGVALLEGDREIVAALVSPLAADAKHVGIDVADGDAHVRPAGLHHAEGDVAGAAGEIEQGEVPVALRRIDRGDQRVLPGAMQPARHQVVHQVVAARNRMEHVVDHALLVGQGHGAFAEMGLVLGGSLPLGHGQ